MLEITLINGSIIQGIPGSEPERYRGKQFHGGWFDELCAFEYIDDAYDQVQFTMRLKDPAIPRVQQIVTTTPKPKELIVDLNEGKIGGEVYVVNASSYDNKANLSSTFFKQLETYEGTDLGKQEIYGEILNPEDAGIIKRKWFKMWPAKQETPTLEYVIASYDPATSEKTHNDPTACEVWGVFERPDAGTCLMLLDAWDTHLSYPELRKKVIADFKEVVYGSDQTFAKGRKADLILMEDKSAGISLVQELQGAGIPVRAYNPGKADKVQRLNIVAPLIAKGKVYIPEDPENPGEYAAWAKRFLRQVCSFPESGGHDDYVDSLSIQGQPIRPVGTNLWFLCMSGTRETITHNEPNKNTTADAIRDVRYTTGLRQCWPRPKDWPRHLQEDHEGNLRLHQADWLTTQPRRCEGAARVRSLAEQGPLRAKARPRDTGKSYARSRNRPKPKSHIARC